MSAKEQLIREGAEKEALAATFTRYAKILAEVLDGIPSAVEGGETRWKGSAVERYLINAGRLVTPAQRSDHLARKNQLGLERHRRPMDTHQPVHPRPQRRHLEQPEHRTCRRSDP
ncbi:hypothetical protein [Nonomuraea sp. NPDC049309]|uniref:hypothetical protein n=1 Tax=Nonomuraea sp. NPDC049309 TaxID=3364350 RepID=UPI003721D86C